MENFNPFAGGVIERVAPSTLAQREVIASSQMSDEANTAFNEGVTVTLSGKIEAERMRKSFEHLVDRHESFRATFSRKGDEICLLDSARARFEYVDLNGRSDNEYQDFLKDLYRNIAISPMNLEEGPLVFAWLVSQSDQVHQLVIAAHHVICDGWSFGLILQELSKIYSQGGKTDGLGAAPSFFDFAEKSLATQVTNRDVDFWKEKFRDIPPNLDLPLDFKRPAQRTFAADRIDYVMDAGVTANLKKAAAGMKSSLVNLVLSAYSVLLHRLTGNEDIVIGLPVAGQAAMNQLSLVGHMVQLLPIRLSMEKSTPFETLLAQVKETVLDAGEHPGFTYGELVKDLPVDRSRVPLISTLFNIDQKMPDLPFGEASGAVDSLPRASENFELFLNVVPKDDSLVVEATYSTSLFTEETVMSWLGALEQILVTVSKTSGALLAEIPLAQEEPAFAAEVNQTRYECQYSSMIEAVGRAAGDYPDNVAVVCADRVLNYAELWSRVMSLSAYLAENGVSEGQIVGVCCERSENLIIATLALHCLGAAYLPLDPGFPKDRLAYMCEDAGVTSVLADEKGQALLADSMASILDVSKGVDGSPAITPIASRADRLAYIIYTSGSTGKPKGVEINCGAMINLLESMLVKPGMEASNTLLAVTTLAFDISIVEFFLPLMVGGKIVMAEQRDLKDGDAINRLIQDHKVDYLQSTPATFRLLMGSEWSNNTDKRMKALCCGEPLPPDLAAGLVPRVAELWNMFGPTETTVYATRKHIVDAEDPITIGLPIENTRVFILDECLQPVPMSVPGELCVAGDNLAVAYHGREDLTAEKFVEHPVYGRIYRTGDLAKWNRNAEVVHLGRMDDQVKVRGYRIELGEIERTITQTGLVDSAAAYLWQISDTDIRIVACCVARTEADMQLTELRKALRKTLPSYMIPQYFLPIESIPLSGSGKVDRKALPRPQEQVSTLVDSGELSTETQKQVAAIWAELVKPGKPLGPQDSFFEIGGHSLLALEAIRQIEKAFGVRLTVHDLIASKLEQICAELDVSRQNKAVVIEGPTALPVQEKRVLSDEQTLILSRQLASPDSLAYSLEAAWILEGELVPDLFQGALKSVFERQTALRTRIVKTGSGYEQSLFPVTGEPLAEEVDCSQNSDALSVAMDGVAKLFEKPIGVVDEAMYRLALFKVSSKQWLFAFGVHQLVFDGWSYDIFLKELAESYSALREKRVTRLSPLPYEFRDYAHWVNTHAKEERALKSIEFHRQSLRQSASLKPLFKEANKGNVVSYRKQFSQQHTELLAAICERHSLRDHEILFAVFARSVSDVLESRDICFGLPVTGRFLPDAINLIGSFVSTLPLHIHFSNESVASAVASITEQVKAFREHQEVSLSNVLAGTDWENGRQIESVIPVTFAFQNVSKREQSLSDLSLAQHLIPRRETLFPLESWVRVEESSLVLFFDYDSHRVSAGLIESLAERFETNLQALNSADELVADIQSEKPTKKNIWRRLFG